MRPARRASRSAYAARPRTPPSDGRRNRRAGARPRPPRVTSAGAPRRARRRRSRRREVRAPADHDRPGLPPASRPAVSVEEPVRSLGVSLGRRASDAVLRGVRHDPARARCDRHRPAHAAPARRRDDPAARAARADGRDPVPAAVGGASGHVGALRREGQPAPGPAARPRRGRGQLRRRQPGRGARLSRGRRPARRPRLLQPDQAARRHPRVRRARRAPVRRRLARGDPQGRGRGPRHLGAVPHRHVRQRLGLAALAQVRLLDRRGRDRPAARRGAGPRPGRGVLPRRLPAARPVGLGRPDRGVLTGLRRAAPRAGCRRGCSTWAAASRPRWRAARPRSTPTAPPSPAL